jgi:hypothetical protein
VKAPRIVKLFLRQAVDARVMTMARAIAPLMLRTIVIARRAS